MPTIKYKLADGTPIKGATTVSGQNIAWGKGGLMYWANKQGLEGNSLNDARDTATVPGTIAHYLIECWLKEEEAKYEITWSEKDIKAGKSAFDNFLRWTEQFQMEPIYIEPNLVSARYKYGGTPDVIARVMDRIALVDWKSGKFYESGFCQLAAYTQLVQENYDLEIEEYHILRIPRDRKRPSFHHNFWEAPLPDEAWGSFERALYLSEAQKVLKQLL